MLMKDKLIVALDVAGRAQALRLVEALSGHVGAFKIGMQLFDSEGPQIVRDVQALGGRVFVDLKFHDIPNTVAEAAKVISQKGAFMFTVHASGGYKMMRAAAEASREAALQAGVGRPLVVGVTVLTSISQQVFNEEIGIPRTIAEQVVDWAKLAQKAGLDGVVASPLELAAIREACGKDFLIVTPGVRPRWAAANDQERVMTPGEAIAQGASYLVVGRPITAHADPRAAAGLIAAEMS
ncbi:MAG: orotidine-5'-phosphate decarboxylase, partial [Clostridiales bacterium]|nr:orotidine-5'-phosphate decarboxylase [Clostridiales bacterium]